MKALVMNSNLSTLVTLLRHTGALAQDQQHEFRLACATIPELTAEQTLPLLEAMVQSVGAMDEAGELRCEEVLAQLALRARTHDESLQPTARERISFLYNHLREGSTCRARLLQWLATAAGDDDLRLYVELITAHPPRDGRTAAVVMAPLFQRTRYDSAALFPGLLAALQHLTLAAPVLDLANYLTRSRRVDRHPCQERLDELVALLGSVVQRLAKLEESPHDATQDLEAMRHQVDEGVAVVVSLCHALGLIGDPRSVGKLHQALELAHRRVRVEAAAALARLGEQAGKQALLALAAEPVVRLHVLDSAQELGLLDQVDPQYATDAARAEAMVAQELAQPTFFGIPPMELELIDTRTQHWPGYEPMVECYLFRYTYRFGGGTYSNVAIAGPLVHAFAADLNDLPPDDIYAAYAGWHVEHDSIYEVPVDELPAVQRTEQERFERRLRDAGYESIQSATLGHFFGDRVLVAHATRGSTSGVAVIDAQEIEWYPCRTRRHCLGPCEAFSIYKGRRLLRTFNR